MSVRVPHVPLVPPAPPVARNPSGAGPGALLALIRSGQAVTRAQIMADTGLSRTTVAQRLDELLAAGLVRQGATEASTGGRPAGAFAVDPAFGVILLAQMHAEGIEIALGDVAGNVGDHLYVPIPDLSGPEPVLALIATHFDAILERERVDRGRLRAIGLGLPGPVEFARGRMIRPPMLAGWDAYEVPAFFARSFPVPVIVDNEANLIAVGEQRLGWPDVADMIVLELGMGIGCGIVAGGRLQRGAHGAAGEIGHGRLIGSSPAVGAAVNAAGRDGAAIGAESEPRCRCGARGCLEAHASGWRIIERLRAADCPLDDLADLAGKARDGDERVIAMLVEAGRRIGETVAHAAALLNPSLIAVGGRLTKGQDHMLAAIKETVFRMTPPLVARDLQILPTRLGDRSGLHGAVLLAADAVLAPATIDSLLLGKDRSSQ